VSECLTCGRKSGGVNIHNGAKWLIHKGILDLARGVLYIEYLLAVCECAKGDREMSNVSTVHDLKPFKAGDKALSGQRLAKIGYKSTAKNPAKFASVAASVPFIQPADITSNITRLLPYVCNMLESAQDGIIRGLYESSQGALKIVQDHEISVEACIGFLEAEAAGNRLTSEAVEKWFDAELSDNVFAMLAQKLGFLSTDAEGTLTDAQETTVAKHVKIYRDVLASLAGGKTMLAEKQVRGCRSALTLAPDSDDPMVSRLSARLDTMERKNSEDFIDL